MIRRIERLRGRRILAMALGVLLFTVLLPIVDAKACIEPGDQQAVVASMPDAAAFAAAASAPDAVGGCCGHASHNAGQTSCAVGSACCAALGARLGLGYVSDGSQSYAVVAGVDLSPVRPLALFRPPRSIG